MIEKKVRPNIKPYKGYNQYNNRRLHYILIPTITDYQRLYPFYCIISFIMGETFKWWYYSAYMEEKTQLKYHGFLTKPENRTIYYKGQMKNDNEEKTK